MSEINLAALADADKPKMESKPNPMLEMNIALKECRFGRFHIRLLATAFIAFVSNVLVTNTTAYLLPIAECDLGMDLVQKGLLNAVPYVGMLLSSMLAGFLTDTFGRKIFLIYGYAGLFLSTLVSASSQTYSVLVAAKFFEGLLFAASFSPTVTLTSEFCYNEIRDRVMLVQSSFVAVAQVVAAGLSWAILTQNWTTSIMDGYFVLHTWNFYLYICSLCPLLACVLYSFIPESPKYLLSQKKYAEAKAVLIQVYKENTGKIAESYPCAHLWINNQDKLEQEEDQRSGFRHQLVVGLYNAKPIIQKPLVMHLTCICTLIFINMSMYNILRLWFPQLSTIIEHSRMGSANVTQDLCDMLDTYTQEISVNTYDMASELCVPRVSGTETYINSMILGCVCVMPYIFSSLLVNKVGKKQLFAICGLIAIAATLGLRWSTSKVAVVALFSLDTAVTQTITSLLQTIVLEFFPTTTRTLAISVMMMFGRIGTLVGNIAFPILLNMRCIIPFYTLAGMMALVTALTFLLPAKKK